jgi:hypothetical protein
LDKVSWNVDQQSGNVLYSYVPDSHLIHQITTNSNQKTTYGYEKHRDLKTQVINRYNDQVISQYDYVFDPIGNMANVTQKGSDFVQSSFRKFGYNTRSELNESQTYMGSNLNDSSKPISSQFRSYKYDSIGNRLESTESTDSHTYLTNELNQYTEQQISPTKTTKFGHPSYAPKSS